MQVKKLLSYVGIPYVVETVYSAINGEIKVVSVFGKNSISAGNLTQSGPIVEDLWKEAIKRIKIYDLRFKNILVLGVAGGSAIKVLRENYPKVKITGVEIDRKMIEIGKKFFNLGSYKAKIIVQDATVFVGKTEEKRFDLILVDILIGRSVPKKFLQLSFLTKLSKLIRRKGVVVFNRLRIRDTKSDSKFICSLKYIFASVKIYRPLINTLIFCTLS